MPHRAVEYLGRVSEAELDVEVRGLLSFDDCPSILRASGLATLMRQLGKVIDSSSGSAETYEMSVPVDKIQIFLSHNWAVPRFKKFICLAVYFNWIPAMIITTIVLAITAVLTARGYFPMLERYAQLEGYKDPAWREGFVCTAVSFPVFLLVILFWRDLLWLIGWYDIPTFLDKTCIHQEDKQVMRMGIERLGAFLMRSEEMLALYTETYMTKLWTTYEVASFLSLHGAGKIRVLPIWHAVLLLVSQGSCWLFSVCLAISHEFLADYRVLYVVGFFLAGFFMREHRHWEHHKVVLENRVRYFRVQECTCAIESDRAIVYENISRLMRASGTVSKHASQEAALEAFNHRVRNELLGAFKLSLGRNTFRFQHYFTMGWFLSGGRILDMFVSLHLGLAPRYVICNCLFGATWVCGGWIVFLLICEKIAAVRIQWTGIKEFLYCVAAASFLVAIGISSSLGAAAIRYHAETSDRWLVLCIALPIFTAVLAATLINGWYERCLCCRRRARAREDIIGPVMCFSSERPDHAPSTTTLPADLESPGTEATEATDDSSPQCRRDDVVLEVQDEKREGDKKHDAIVDLDQDEPEPQPSPHSSWAGSVSVSLDADPNGRLGGGERAGGLGDEETGFRPWEGRQRDQGDPSIESDKRGRGRIIQSL